MKFNSIPEFAAEDWREAFAVRPHFDPMVTSGAFVIPVEPNWNWRSLAGTSVDSTLQKFFVFDHFQMAFEETSVLDRGFDIKPKFRLLDFQYRQFVDNSPLENNHLSSEK